MIPPAFDGMVLIDRTMPDCHFMETDVDLGNTMPFTIYFYRREGDGENLSLGQFVESIRNCNIGWDKPTQQLFYRDMGGKLYKLNFEEV
jgi:hypothetical protein